MFQRMDAATGNERPPTVARRYAGTCSRCDEDERRRWRPGRSATWTIADPRMAETVQCSKCHDHNLCWILTFSNLRHVDKHSISPNQLSGCVAIVTTVETTHEARSSSHTRTVVRECFKGDEASLWKRSKIDPSPHQNPLTDLHNNWQAWLCPGRHRACKIL